MTKAKDFTLSNLISNRYEDTEGHRDITDKEYNFHAEAFREFLLSTCRKNSKRYNRIENLNFLMVENHPRYERLIFNKDLNKVEYIAGQEHKSEIETLKQLLVG